MSVPIISVRNVGKRYQIGEKAHDTLRDQITYSLKSLKNIFAGRQKSGNGENSDSSFWALKEVSFDVLPGDVVAIIGSNGAGKSTLLKILSQITEPTTGEIRIKGKMASLLEVGTGFHPELTGRENIFLNGAILGMSRVEIKRKFDEIVAFAEVEKFLDTPVKRYSSGMYVRLAFAVAAHLEPDILVVDEVLAVGDAAFQARCFSKMGEVANQQGRTVLFVSHNMQAVQAICRSAMLMEKGCLKAQGETRKIVAQYLAGISNSGSDVRWKEQEAPGNHEVKLTGIRILDEDQNCSGTYSSSKDIFVDMELMVHHLPEALCVGFDLLTLEGETVARALHNDQEASHWPALKLGRNVLRCHLPSGLLNNGTYVICPRITVHYRYWIVKMDGCAQFTVIMDHGVSPYWNAIRQRSNRPGVISPIFKWTAED